MSDTQKLPERAVGDTQYLVRTMCHTPFCHLCRKRVDAVTILESSFNGNPIHACQECLSTRLKGFSEVTPTERVSVA